MHAQTTGPGGAIWLGERYFSMVALGGNLLFPAGGSIAPWDAKAMFYCDSAVVDHMMEPEKGDRKITTEGELEHVLAVSQKGDASIRIWIHEDLEDLIKQLMD